MAVRAPRTRSADSVDAARIASTGPVPVRRSGTEVAVRAPAGAAQRSSPRVADGIRAAAAVMGWALWILLALVTAAFLAFAPPLL